jgi:hypothetical protein
LKMRLERRRRRKKWYKYIEGNYRSTGRALVLTHTHGGHGCAPKEKGERKNDARFSLCLAVECSPRDISCVSKDIES